MTRTTQPELQAALERGEFVYRDFIWLIAKDRETGEPVEFGVWSDVGSYQCDVIDPYTGGTVTRSFLPAGQSIQIPDISLVQGLAVQSIEIVLNQVDESINDFVRTYNCKQAQLQIHRGFYDPDSRILVAPAFPRFLGFVDDMPIKTPAENSDGGITVTAVPNSQELMRANSDTRSDDSQHLRGEDDFYQGVGTASDGQEFWGRAAS